MFSATDSAVRVLPTPGGPERSIIMPLPLPWMTSSNTLLFWTCDLAKARMRSFWSEGRTRLSKAESFQVISQILSTAKSTKGLWVRC